MYAFRVIILIRFDYMNVIIAIDFTSSLRTFQRVPVMNSCCKSEKFELHDKFIEAHK